MRDHGLRRFVFVVVLLLAPESPTLAACVPQTRTAVEVGPAPAAIVLAESWSIGKFVAGGGRGRVVQFCVVVMCIALFIMMRKLT